MHHPLAIIIPAYNEEAAIGKTVADYKAHFPDAVFVVVDNNSSDNTFDVARAALDPDKDHLIKEFRQGKGYAVKSGLSRVDAQIYLMTDGDLTYPAEEAKRLYERMLAERPDVLVGDRASSGAYSAQNNRLGHSFGNKVLTGIISKFSGQKFNDVLSGLRVMSRQYVASLDVRSEGFQLETEMNIVAAYLRAHVVEEPINYVQRGEDSESKLNTIRDGIRILNFAFFNWVAFYPMKILSRIALVLLIASVALMVRVYIGFASTGFEEMIYPSTAALAFVLLSLAVFTLYVGVMLRIIGRNARRRDVAAFLDQRRRWNGALDAFTS